MTKQWIDVHEHSQETELPSGWTVEENFVFQNGRRVVAKLTIRPTTAHSIPAGGVTARLLRAVKLGQFAGALRQAMAKRFGPDTARRFFDGMAWSARPVRMKQPARRRVDDQFYAELARDYVTLGQMATKKPTAELAKMRGVRPEQMRSQIRLARVNGFLTETSRGKAGGTLTPKAHQVLERKSQLRKKKDK